MRCLKPQVTDLRHTGETDYTYDAHGNMLSMPHLQAMHWDYNDWLTHVDLDATGNKAHYVYDSAGERVRKVVEKGNIKEERLYFGDYEIYRKFVSGVLETERTTVNIRDDKAKIATVDTLTVDQSSLIVNPTAVVRYQLDNHLGSASLELDETADIITYEEYHPFGTTSYRSGRTETETSQKRYKYVGKERDEETGLYYYGFRYYAAWLCRFVSVDPLQFDYPNYTPFQYAGNKPITYIDLDGLEEALTPYMDRGKYVKTKNVFDFSQNVMTLLSNTLVVGTYNASSGIINAVYNYEETGKAIANSRIGEYVKTAFNSGSNVANLELAVDIVSFTGNVIEDLSNTTWKDVGQSFTTWENYESVIDLAVGAKASGGFKSVGKKTLTSKKSIANVIDDVPVKKKFWNKPSIFEDIKVFQRDDIFDPSTISSWKVNGKTVTGPNVERMASGRAPIGVDGKSVNLHHMIQSETGGIAEMTQTFHKTNHATIHINPNTIPSGINRSQFDAWRGRYWENRAIDFQ